MRDDHIRQERVATAIARYSQRAARAYQSTIRKRAAMNREFAVIQAGVRPAEPTQSEETP